MYVTTANEVVSQPSLLLGRVSGAEGTEKSKGIKVSSKKVVLCL